MHDHACIGQGDVARNKDVIAPAVDKLGLRPSQAMVEQAVYQFFSLCIPRSQEICSSLRMHCNHFTHAS